MVAPLLARHRVVMEFIHSVPGSARLTSTCALGSQILQRKCRKPQCLTTERYADLFDEGLSGTIASSGQCCLQCVDQPRAPPQVGLSAESIQPLVFICDREVVFRYDLFSRWTNRLLTLPCLSRLAIDVLEGRAQIPSRD
jgi:hypothetical protein